MGIATALNQASAFGLSSGFEWMLALDQDSECPPTFCKILSSYFDNPRIGIVAPVIQDRDSGIIGHNLRVSTVKYALVLLLGHVHVFLLGKR